MDSMDQQTPSTSHQEEGVIVKRRLYTSELLQMWNLVKIYRELGTKDQCLAFAEEQGLLLAEKMCRVHKKPMSIDKSYDKAVGAFVCNRGSCRGRSRRTRSNGTVFENIKIDIVHVFYLMYCFANNFAYDTVIKEDFLKTERQKCLSPNTISDWYNCCREVIVIYQLDNLTYTGKIGGPAKTVQIYKSKFAKRMYSKRRQVEECWVLCLIEDGSEDLRLEVCQDDMCSEEVLVPLIKSHVLDGTTIYTDNWCAYDCLGSHGFIHKKVNSVDDEDDTQSQRKQRETQWRFIKRFFNKNDYNRPENFADVIVEYMWRQYNFRHKKDPFLEIIKAVKHAYNT